MDRISKKKIVIWLSLALLTLSVIIGLNVFNFSQEKIAIAIVAPLTSEDRTTAVAGESLLKGAQLYIDEINENGGIKGKKLELRVYDDKGQVDEAIKVARDIVSSSAIAVIGHFSIPTSVAAGKIYQAYGIPAITGSATADEVTKWNNWYFRTIFSNKLQGTFIANYINKILEYPRISLVYSSDIYGVNLAEDIEVAFEELGGEIFRKWEIKENSYNLTKDKIVEDLVAFKEEGEDPGMIVMATDSEDSSSLLAKIRLHELEFPIFGGNSLGEVSLAHKFANSPQEQNEPGFFTNGVYALAPIIYDISGEKGQQFRNRFEERYGYIPGWFAAGYYDAAHAVVAAIEQSFSDEKQLLQDAIAQQDLRESRYLIKEALAKLKPIETTIEAQAQETQFNSQGDPLVPYHVGVFDRGKFISAFTQLELIPDVEKVSDFNEQLESGQIIQVGNQYLEKTDIVYVGIDINEVSKIDEKSSSFLLDFYLWFRYQGDVNAENIEFTNYSTERLDSGEKFTLDEPIVEEKQGDINYKVYRVKADFNELFDFRNYPLDSQTLAVRFRHANLTRDKLIYVVDYVGIKDTTTKAILEKWERGKVFDKITDWNVEKISFYPDIMINTSTLGDRRFIDTDSEMQYSRFNAVVEIERDFISFSDKNLLPLFFFVVVAYLILFLPFEDISIEAVSGLLLAVVFYHLSLIDALPEGVGYVVALDYAFYIVYTLLALELLLLTIGRSNRFHEQKQSVALMKFSRIAFPVVLLISSLLFYWKYV
ncbi:MAG: ABC transporter substrate-binding protein [Oscillatoria sp. PMC 1051.18]|nr:ABC transporter substrate-binding protein [Oscillatoria sp. PMC 1050.18]MEC5029144.1 ABC transporter substrate-binding protein [Oscillatoria sp. PMC 1051.18]